MKVAIYRLSDGLILRRVIAPPFLISIQYDPETEEFYLNCPDGATHIIDGSPVTVPPSLEEIKIFQKSIIKASMEAGRGQGCVTSLGFRVDAQREDLQNFQAAMAYMSAENLPDITVRDFDNQSRTGVTIEQMQTIVNELIAFGLQQYEKKWLLEAQIDAATTPEEVTAIIW